MYRETLFDAAGPLRDAYYAVDWAATPLGAPSSWSLALRNAVDLALHTDFAITLLWGPEFILVYNAAYVPLIAEKHPAALGRPAEEVFPEAWDTIGPMLREVSAGRGGVHNTDMHLPLQRRGRLEEAFFDFSYSPVRGADGLIEGVLDITAETTGRVVSARRLEVLTGLRELASTVDREQDLRQRAVELLRADARDFGAVELQPGPGRGRDLPGTARPVQGARVETTTAGRVGFFAAGDDVLAVRLSDELQEDEPYLGFLGLIAFTLGQALRRIGARETERDVAQIERRISETLQHSMLTRLEETRVATRYLPAVQEAYVGGDWYDAFRLPDGALALVIGDVAGHDQAAAAAMAQLKSMLRALAVSGGDGPAGTLNALDLATEQLGLGLYASATLARLEEGPDGPTLRWANAGHPPPVLIHPDGSTELLERAPDLMLGVGIQAREDHVVALEPGSSVVLYTDGLVERRSETLDTGFQRLLQAVSGLQDLGAEELADALLSRLMAGAEDDVALLVLGLPAAT